MGYKRKLYRFTFTDPELAGLEVVARPVSVDQILSIQDDIEALKDAAGADKEITLRMANLFVSSLVSWTVEEDDGTPAPLPASGKDFMNEDASMALAVMTEWQQRVIRVAPPLPESFSGGPASALEQSLPMAPLSPNQPNSDVPVSSSALSASSADTP